MCYSFLHIHILRTDPILSLGESQDMALDVAADASAARLRKEREREEEAPPWALG